MVESSGNEVARRGPQPGRWIIEFRTKGSVAGVKSPSHDHHAVRQECCRMGVSCW